MGSHARYASIVKRENVRAWTEDAHGGSEFCHLLPCFYGSGAVGSDPVSSRRPRSPSRSVNVPLFDPAALTIVNGDSVHMSHPKQQRQSGSSAQIACRCKRIALRAKFSRRRAENEGLLPEI